MIEDDDEAAALLLAEAVMGCKEVEIDELELITPIREARKKLLLGSAFRPLGDDPEDEKINPTESSAISKLLSPYGYPYGGSSSPGVSEAARFLEEGPQRMLHATLLGVDGYDVKDAPAAVPAPSVLSLEKQRRQNLALKSSSSSSSSLSQSRSFSSSLEPPRSIRIPSPTTTAALAKIETPRNEKSLSLRRLKTSPTKLF